MTVAHTERLIAVLRANGVNYFKSHDVEIRMGALESPTSGIAIGPGPVPRGTQAKVPETAAAAPPVDVKIPHHMNQVVSMLKMNDEQLVDVLFPEGAPPQPKAE